MKPNKKKLKNKIMKITNFKKGDLITRIKVSDEYTSEPKYELDSFIFSEISNGKIWLIHFNECKDYELEIFSEVFEKRKEDEWEYYIIPDILTDLLLEQMCKSKLLLCKLLRKHLIKNSNITTYENKQRNLRILSR
jgi:hypothetical protein